MIDAAEQSRAPIIIGFNGDFLSRPDRLAQQRLDWSGSLGQAAAESALVPCGLIFNECPLDDWVRSAVTAGFNLVMPADPHAPHDEYVGRVAELSRFAHSHGVAVEAEVGELPCGLAAEGEEGGSSTDPEQAARFVASTGVDLLAVSVGTFISSSKERGFGPDRLAAIRGESRPPGAARWNGVAPRRPAPWRWSGGSTTGRT